MEEGYIKQYVFGSSSKEDIEVVKNALEIAEEYLYELDEEQTELSKCIEQQQIEWEENLEQCRLEDREDCDEIEDFLKELKEVIKKK